DDRHAGSLGPEPLGDLEALHVGQHHVEQHEVRAKRLDLADGVLAGAGRRDVEALVAQRHRDDVHDVGLVVDDEDAKAFVHGVHLATEPWKFLRVSSTSAGIVVAAISNTNQALPASLPSPIAWTMPASHA